jgi:hypothetical protein
MAVAGSIEIQPYPSPAVSSKPGMGLKPLQLEKRVATQHLPIVHLLA